MYRPWAVVAGVLASGAVLSGQQTSQTPIFRGGTSLVRVDVTVLDRAGKPVPGLTADDFEVMFDGRVQKVETVDYQTAPTTRAVSATSGRQATNATPVHASRLVVVLVDDLTIGATNDRDLFHAGSRFVASLPESDLVGFTTTSGEAVINPTRDHAAVEVGLRRAVGKFTDVRNLPPDVVVGLNEAMEIEGGNQGLFVSVVERDCLNGRRATARDLESVCADDVARKSRQIATMTGHTTDMQMASFKAVIHAMQPAEGEKVLVILSEGLIMSTRGQRQAVDIRDIERDAAAAGVHVSVLYPDPDLISMAVRSSDESKVARDDGQMLGQGIENIVGATGGDFYRVVGQPDRFFGFVTDTMSAVYHLGVEAPPGSVPGREFKLSARVRRPDVTVRANRVALQNASPVAVSVDAQLRAAVTTGELKYGVPIAVGTVIRPGKAADEVGLGVNVEVPAGVSGPLTVLFGAVDEKGGSRTGSHTLSAQVGGGNYRLSFSIAVPPASYRLRVAIADAQGQVGSVDMPVEAQLTRLGPFQASDILTAWTGTDGKPQFLSLGNVPATAKNLLMGLELMPGPGAAPPSGVGVTWTIVSESGQTLTEQSVAPAFIQNRLNAQAQISVASLPPGSYELRAAILIANQAVGVRSAIFHKADTSACPAESR